MLVKQIKSLCTLKKSAIIVTWVYLFIYIICIDIRIMYIAKYTQPYPITCRITFLHYIHAGLKKTSVM